MKKLFSIVVNLILLVLAWTVPASALEGEYVLYALEERTDSATRARSILAYEGGGVVDEAGDLAWYTNETGGLFRISRVGDGTFTTDRGWLGSYTADKNLFVLVDYLETTPSDDNGGIAIVVGIRKGSNLPLNTFGGLYYLSTIDFLSTTPGPFDPVITQYMGLETRTGNQVDISVLLHSDDRGEGGVVGYTADSQGRVQMEVGPPFTILSNGEIMAGAGTTAHLSNPALGIAIKSGSGIQPAQLSGTYRFYGFSSVNGTTIQITSVSEMTFDGAGNGTTRLIAQTPYLDAGTETFTYALSQDGQFVLSNRDQGMVGSSGEVISIVDTDAGDGSLSLGMGIRIFAGGSDG